MKVRWPRSLVQAMPYHFTVIFMSVIFKSFLADRTNGRAYAAVLCPSVRLSLYVLWLNRASCKKNCPKKQIGNGLWEIEWQLGSVSANSSKPIKDTDFNFDKRVSGGSPESGHDSLKFMEKGRGQGYVTQIFLKSLGGGMHSCELLL